MELLILLYNLSPEEYQQVLNSRVTLTTPEKEDALLANVIKNSWQVMSISNRAASVAAISRGRSPQRFAASLGISPRNSLRYLKVNGLSIETKKQLDAGEISLNTALKTEDTISVSSHQTLGNLTNRTNSDKPDYNIYDNLDSALNYQSSFGVPSKPLKFGPGKVENTPCTSFDAAAEAFREWIEARKPPTICKPKIAGQVKRIVSINDLHCPDHNEEALAEFIHREKGKVDQLVISGDLAHYETMSRFEKFTKKFSPVEEVQKTKVVLNLLAENFPDIVYFGGNHDARPMNYFAKSMPADILDYIRFVGPGVLSPIEFMIADLPNVKMAPSIKLPTSAEYRFLYQIGDLILGHPEVYSQVNLKAGADFVDWLMRYALPRGIIQPFKFAAMGHTHQAGKVWCDYGKIAMEMGCMCHDGDYTGSAKIRSSRRPWKLGYTVFEMENGVTNEETSNFIPLQLN